ncbi:hypothetical protein F4677DRAFT_445269 [Hypoxylon crocopeplum]|nr:hypothetical protein F4677DRAFT_445269 [Hypoxylon crocopeplum]
MPPEPLVYNAFAVITGVAATIQQSISLFQSIRGAINSRKNLSSFINQQYKEARRTSRLIELVKKEEALQTPAIIFALQDVDEAGKKLNARLVASKRSLKKRNIQLIGNALFPDPEEEKKLQAEIKELELAKENLNSCILLYNVGLTRDMNNNIKVQTVSIDRLGRAMKDLGARDGLQIEERTDTDMVDVGDEIDEDFVDAVSEPGPSGLNAFEEDTPITLSPGNSVLESETTASSTASPTVSTFSQANKVIKRNKCGADAMMINAPTAEIDTWKGDNVTIKKNVAGESSTMFNYPNSEKFLLEIARIRSGREPQSRKSSLSFLKK